MPPCEMEGRSRFLASPSPFRLRGYRKQQHTSPLYYMMQDSGALLKDCVCVHVGKSHTDGRVIADNLLGFDCCAGLCGAQDAPWAPPSEKDTLVSNETKPKWAWGQKNVIDIQGKIYVCSTVLGCMWCGKRCRCFSEYYVIVIVTWLLLTYLLWTLTCTTP